MFQTRRIEITPRQILAGAWTLIVIYVGMVVGGNVTSEGIREMCGYLAVRLPFGFLFYPTGLKRFDIATVLALGLMVGVLVVTHLALRDYLLVNPVRDPEVKPNQHRTFVRVVGYACIVLDAVFFHAGIAQLNSWQRSNESWAALVLTALYICLLLVSCYVNIVLWLRAERK